MKNSFSGASSIGVAEKPRRVGFFAQPKLVQHGDPPHPEVLAANGAVHRTHALRAGAAYDLAHNFHETIDRVPPRFLLCQSKEPRQIGEAQHRMVAGEHIRGNILIFALTQNPQTLSRFA